MLLSLYNSQQQQQQQWIIIASDLLKQKLSKQRFLCLEYFSNQFFCEELGLKMPSKRVPFRLQQQQQVVYYEWKNGLLNSRISCAHY